MLNSGFRVASATLRSRLPSTTPAATTSVSAATHSIIARSYSSPPASNSARAFADILAMTGRSRAGTGATNAANSTSGSSSAASNASSSNLIRNSLNSIRPNNNSNTSIFGNLGGRLSNKLTGSFNPQKPNTTSNPIHLSLNHATEGRSFRVPLPIHVDTTYRRLNVALNKSQMRQELRQRRTYETGHVRMRREHQERNKRLFGAMVRKKIELIKLMKLRGM